MNRSQRMVDYTEGKKNDTIRKVQDAIDLMKLQGRQITRKALLEESGVSNAVLSKPYVKNVLEQNMVLMYERKNTISKVGEHQYSSLLKENENLRKRIQKLDHKCLEYEIIIKNKDSNYNNISKEYDDIKIKYERLLGKWQKMLEYIKNSGAVTPVIEHLFRL